MKKEKPMKKVMELVDDYVNAETLKIDPNGSYTGKCEDEKEKPVQDADDL